MPTTGTISGLTFSQDANAAFNALLNDNSGSSAPTNTVSGVPDKGQSWLDTSVTPNCLRKYDGANWVIVGYLDSVNSIWTPPIGGGTATIASVAGTTDLWASAATSITISGTNTITQFASASAVPGSMKLVTASGAFTMTHDATKLIIPNGLPYTVAAGDQFLVLALTSTNVRIYGYSKVDGTSLKVSNRLVGELIDWTGSTAAPLTVFPVGQTLLRASYPDLWTFAQAEITAGSPLYNVGNGSTTFGIMDKRGRVSSTNDSLGGSAAGRTTGAIGAGIGGQTATIVTANLPPYTPVMSSTALSTTNLAAPLIVLTGGGSTTHNWVTADGSGGALTSSIPQPQGGISTPLSNLQASLVTNCLLFTGAP
jgi:microcystin-dependent protein